MLYGPSVDWGELLASKHIYFYVFDCRRATCVWKLVSSIGLTVYSSRIMQTSNRLTTSTLANKKVTMTGSGPST